NRKIGPPIDDAIAIVPPQRGKPRVESLRHGLRREHSNGMWPQVCVDGIAHRVRVPGLREIDMSHLAERMDAGIGPPGPLDGCRLATKGGYCRGQQSLNSQTGILHLPADERRSVILNDELIAGHV